MKGVPQARAATPEASASAPSEVGRLFQSEAPQLRRYFRSKTGDYEGAADLVQDAFVKMVEVPLADIRNPAAYLQRIARNLVADWFRSRKGSSRSDHVPLEECDVAVTSHEEDLDLFERALAGLPPKTRTVFLMKRVEGRTYEEIGGRLAISVKTVEYHMKQAMLHISRFLEGQ